MFLLLLLLSRPLELHRLGTVAVGGAVGHVMYLRPDEHGKVQQSDHRQQRATPVARQQAAHHVNGEQRRVQIGQPFHLDGDNEEQQHLRIREQERKGEEHGQVHVGGARHADEAVAGDKAGQNGADHRQEHTAEIVEIELGGAPLLLQCGADPVVKVQADDEHQRGAGAGIEDECHDAPDLAVEQTVQVELEKVQRGGIGVHCQHGQDIHRRVADDDDAHQIGNTKAGVGGAEALHPVIELFQGERPPVSIQVTPIVAHRTKKVMSFF